LLLTHDDDSLEDANLHPHLLLLKRKYRPLGFMLIFDDFTFLRVHDDYFLHEFHDGLNWLNVRLNDETLLHYHHQEINENDALLLINDVQR
jgi:hypothetical protein